MILSILPLAYCIGLSLVVNAAPMQSEIQPSSPDQQVIQVEPPPMTLSSPSPVANKPVRAVATGCNCSCDQVRQTCVDNTCFSTTYRRYKEWKRAKEAQNDPRIIRATEVLDDAKIEYLKGKFDATEEEIKERLKLKHTLPRAELYTASLIETIMPYIVQWGDIRVANLLVHDYSNYKTAMAISCGNLGEKREAVQYLLHRWQADVVAWKVGSEGASG